MIEELMSPVWVYFVIKAEVNVISLCFKYNPLNFYRITLDQLSLLFSVLTMMVLTQQQSWAVATENKASSIYYINLHFELESLFEP